MLEVGHPRRSCLTFNMQGAPGPCTRRLAFCNLILFIYYTLSQPVKIALLTENQLSRNFHETDIGSPRRAF